MPVRRIPRSRRSIRGMHPWRVRGRSLRFESTLERDFITRMVFDPEVVEVGEQPIEIIYTRDGRRRTYTPDFLVTFRYRPGIVAPRHVIYEVKYWDDLRENWTEHRPKFEAAREWARNRAMGFRLATDRSIRGPELENAKRLIPFLASAGDPEHDEALLATLRRHGRIAVATLMQLLSTDRLKQAHFYSSLWRLMAAGRVLADFSMPIAPTTLVAAADGGDQ